MEIFLGFLAGFALGAFAHVCAMFVLIHIIRTSSTIVEFSTRMIGVVKTLAVAVVIIYLILGSMAYPFVLFAALFCFTLARVEDFEVTFKEVKGYNLP